jgi:hypothetical protein
MVATKYYKFDIGNGAMRRTGGIVEYLDKNGNWVEKRDLLRKFIGGDTDFDEISCEEAEKLVEERKKQCLK